VELPVRRDILTIFVYTREIDENEAIETIITAIFNRPDLKNLTAVSNNAGDNKDGGLGDYRTDTISDRCATANAIA
jgi:hypothetical protein